MRCAVLRRPLFLAAAASAAALALPAVASADLVAAYDHAVPGSGLDIGMIDVNTGAAIPAPAGVNTSGDETHPSLSADGSTLVFERNGVGVRVPIRPAGATGTWSALAPPPIATPSLSPDGTRQIAGRGALQPDGRSIGTQGKRGVVNIDASEVTPPLSAPFAQPSGGTADPSIDDGTNPAMAWSTSNGRYMGFLRRGLDGHVSLEVFDSTKQRLLPSGIDLGFDPDSNARRVNTGLALALDPTRFHTVCTGSFPQLRCLPSNAGPTA